MKKVIGVSLFIVIGIGIYYFAMANPIFVQTISELAFTPNGWVLEIRLHGSANTSGWYLTSKQDTAHLKPMTLAADTLYLITQDSLLEQFRIDSSGDDLKFYTAGGGLMSYLTFGSLPGANIAAPKVGQSICLSGWADYYLDNTPTLGYPNDTVNAMGYINGWVKNNSGNSLQSVKVWYGAIGNYPGNFVLTDDTGFFTISSISQKSSLIFQDSNYVQYNTTVQVWPESTVVLNVNLVVSVEKIKAETMPKNFVIGEPFPNPFNPETRIRYTLPQKGEVKIEVFDISGKLVDKIFSGYQSAGSYQARWNATSCPSGTYIIQIRNGYAALSKKCVLVK